MLHKSYKKDYIRSMNTTNMLSAVLGEWFSRAPREDASQREIDGGPLGTNRRITAVIGPRRSGKSTACRLSISELLDQGVPQSNVVYINFEDERLLPATTGLLSDLPVAHREMVDVAPGHPVYYFLDEIQNVPQWSLWMRRITESDRSIRLVVTGSSSKLLSNEIATELRGRCDTVEVFPFSFREYLMYRKQLPAGTEKTLLHSANAPRLLRSFMEYLQWGGFPERFQVRDQQTLLQGYFRAMFVRDLLERFSIKNPQMFGDYLRIQMQRFASLSSLGSLEGDLKSIGYSTAKTTLAEYLDHARDGLLLFDVPLYAGKVTEQLRNPKKIYTIDNGLVRSIRFSGTDDQGRYLENLVFLELRRRTREIYYCKGDTECDFLVAENSRPVRLLQVCWDVSGNSVLQREVRGLTEAMRRYGLSTGMILTRHESGEMRTDAGTVRILPVWWWALNRTAP